MSDCWKDLVKFSWAYPRSEKFTSDEDAHRIDSEARSSGRPALRAPTRFEWLRQFLNSRDRQPMLRDPYEAWRQETLSPISDAVLNTSGRIRRGEYANAFNGMLGALTEAGSGYKAGGGQKGVVRPAWSSSVKRLPFDGGRLAAAGYLSEKTGKPVTWDMLVGNLNKTDPAIPLICFLSLHKE